MELNCLCIALALHCVGSDGHNHHWVGARNIPVYSIRQVQAFLVVSFFNNDAIMEHRRRGTVTDIYLHCFVRRKPCIHFLAVILGYAFGYSMEWEIMKGAVERSIYRLRPAGTQADKRRYHVDTAFQDKYSMCGRVAGSYWSNQTLTDVF